MKRVGNFAIVKQLFRRNSRTSSAFRATKLDFLFSIFCYVALAKVCLG